MAIIGKFEIYPTNFKEALPQLNMQNGNKNKFIVSSNSKSRRHVPLKYLLLNTKVSLCDKKIEIKPFKVKKEILTFILT